MSYLHLTASGRTVVKRAEQEKNDDYNSYYNTIAAKAAT